MATEIGSQAIETIPNPVQEAPLEQQTAEQAPIGMNDTPELPPEPKKRKKAPPVDPATINSPIEVPAPPFKRYFSNAPSRMQYPSQGFFWWRELPAWAKLRLMCYVGRDWPILKKITPEDKEQAKLEGREVEYNYIDKIPGEAPPEDLIQILDRYGSGDYSLTINDTGCKPPRTICQIYIRENWERLIPPSTLGSESGGS